MWNDCPTEMLPFPIWKYEGRNFWFYFAYYAVVVITNFLWETVKLSSAVVLLFFLGFQLQKACVQSHVTIPSTGITATSLRICFHPFCYITRRVMSRWVAGKTQLLSLSWKVQAHASRNSHNNRSDYVKKSDFDHEVKFFHFCF